MYLERPDGGLDKSSCKVISFTMGVTKCENRRHVRLLIACYSHYINNKFSALNHPFQTYTGRGAKNREREFN